MGAFYGATLDGVDLIAWVVLPDHFHILIDPKDSDVSKDIQRIKMSFATSLRHQDGRSSGRTWQNRFWDHIIRDQEDMNRHLDYIHFNPVKHGLVDSPSRWPLTSFRRYLRLGIYQSDWGESQKEDIRNGFGE